MRDAISWWCTLACLCLCLGPSLAQYTNQYNYLDIYPRMNLLIQRDPPKLDNETIDLIFYLHGAVLIVLDNMRHTDEYFAAKDHTVNVEQHSLSGRHMYHSALKSQRLASTEFADSYFEVMTALLKDKKGQYLYSADYEGPLKSAFCEPYHNYKCPENAKYRTIDGTCNNHDHPSWGSAVSCYRRFLPAAYSDGVSAFRLDYYGHPLPNPRLLTNALHYDAQVEAQSYTHFLTQWGQWVAHDITLIKPYLISGRDVLDCCRDVSPVGPYPASAYNRTLYPDPHHPELHPFCRPIYFPDGDEFYQINNVSCQNFVRSAPCPSCKIGPRDQTNKATAYLDGSTVYGSNPETLDYLKDPYDPAKLAVQQHPFGYLLPRNRSPNVDQCSYPHHGQYCFAAGDSRSNQHPGLSILHTLFVRHHNYLVDMFRYINPHWDDYKVFEEVRRVIGAQIQFITYREYIHLVIGPTLMTFFDLWTLKTGNTFYAKVLDAGILNELSAAVYRYGHSLVQSEWYQVDTKTLELIRKIDLKDYFFNSDYMYGQAYDEFLMGMIIQPAMKFDHHISSTLTRHLYKLKNHEPGMDLSSLNIYRGRDHGLQGYTRYLEACYGAKISTFQDLLPFMTQENVNNLKNMYSHVSDIDLWTGGLHERLLRDGLLGPTFGCLIGVQYYFLKFGDRFFLEHGGLPSSFTDRQLTELRKTWFSGIMCKTGDSIYYSTVDVFQPPSKYNPVLPCSQIPQPDWNAWFEHPDHPQENLGK